MDDPMNIMRNLSTRQKDFTVFPVQDLMNSRVKTVLAARSLWAILFLGMLGVYSLLKRPTNQLMPWELMKF